MLTMKQAERFWNLKAYGRLIDELCPGRAEAVGGIRQLINGPVAAAALTVIRMHELLQSHHPFVGKMVRFLVASQASDGGLGDAVTTALAIRALATDRGTGQALESAIRFVDLLQRDDGEWPREPLRRMPGDPAVTAFVLLQLVESRLPQVKSLIDRTVDRITGVTLTGEADAASHAPTGNRRLNPEIDQQLLPLRRRVAARQPSLVGSWS